MPNDFRDDIFPKNKKDDKDDFWDIIFTPKTKEQYEAEEKETERKIIESLKEYKLKYERYESESGIIHHTILYHLEKDYNGHPSNVGIMQCYEHKNISENKILKFRKSERIIPHIVYIDKVLVSDMYRNRGIGKELYKRFGELYKEQLQGVPIARIFNNVLPEYIFRKLIKEGFIDPNAFSEEYIDRLYQDSDGEKIEYFKTIYPEFFPKDIEDYIYQIDIPSKNLQKN
jgi:GNAT superfamily N-acetyltransferase